MYIILPTFFCNILYIGKLFVGLVNVGKGKFKIIILVKDFLVMEGLIYKS